MSSSLQNINSYYPVILDRSDTTKLLNSATLAQENNSSQAINSNANELILFDWMLNPLQKSKKLNSDEMNIQTIHLSCMPSSLMKKPGIPCVGVYYQQKRLMKRIEKVLTLMKQEIFAFKDDNDIMASKMDIINPIEEDDDKKHMYIFEFLGEGSYGKVVKCLVNSKLMYGALKRFKNEVKDNLISELAIYYKLLQEQHSNIANIIEFGMNIEGYYLLLELGSGTLQDLISYLIKYGQKLTLTQALILIKKIALGICSLHKSHIAHRDLKLDNILIFNHECLIKISDFSHAYIFDEDPNIPYQITGNEQYRAPEANELRVGIDTYNATKYDNFQSGIIFDTIRELVCDEEAQKSEILKNIIEMTKNPDPSLRKSADDIVNFIDMITIDKKVIHEATIELLYMILKTSEEVKIMTFSEDISKWFEFAANYKEYGLRSNYTLHILNSFFFKQNQNDKKDKNDKNVQKDNHDKNVQNDKKDQNVQNNQNNQNAQNDKKVQNDQNVQNDKSDQNAQNDKNNKKVQILLTDDKVKLLLWGIPYWIIQHGINCLHLVEKISKKLNSTKDSLDNQMFLYHIKALHLTAKSFLYVRPGEVSFAGFIKEIKEKFQQIDNEKDTLTKLVISCTTYNTFKSIHEKCIFEKWNRFKGRFIELYNEFSNSKPQLISIEKLIQQLLDTFIIETTNTGGSQAVAAALLKGFDSWLYEQIIECLTDTTQRFRFSQMILQRLDSLISSVYSLPSSFGQTINDDKYRDLHTLKITLLAQLSLDCPKLEDSKMFLTQAHKEIEDKGGYILNDIYALYYYAKGISIYRECNANGDANANANSNNDAYEEEKEVSNPPDLTNKLIESTQFLEKALIYILEIKARHELKIKISEKLVEIFFKLGDIRKLKKYLNNYIWHILKIGITNQNQKELLSRLLGLCYLYVYIGQFPKIQKKIEEMWYLIPNDFCIFEQYNECYELFKFFNDDGSFEQKMLFSPQFEKAVSECCSIYRDLEKIHKLAKLSLEAQVPNACITMEDQKFLTSFDQYKENYLQRKNKIESMMSNPDYTFCSKHFRFEDSGKTCLPLEIKSIKKDNGYFIIKGYGYVVFNKGAKYKGDFIIFIFSIVNTLNDNIIHDIKCLGCFLDIHLKDDNTKTMFIFENGQGIFENSDNRTIEGKQKMSSFGGKVIKKGYDLQEIGNACCSSLLGKQVSIFQKVECHLYEGPFFDSMSNGYGEYKCHKKSEFNCYRRNNLTFKNAALKDHLGNTIIEGEWFYDKLVTRVKLD